MPKVKRKLMDKKLDKIEFKLKGLSALYWKRLNKVVQSPLYSNVFEAFQNSNCFHRLTHRKYQVFTFQLQG